MHAGIPLTRCRNLDVFSQKPRRERYVPAWSPPASCWCPLRPLAEAAPLLTFCLKAPRAAASLLQCRAPRRQREDEKEHHHLPPPHHTLLLLPLLPSLLLLVPRLLASLRVRHGYLPAVVAKATNTHTDADADASIGLPRFPSRQSKVRAHTPKASWMARAIRTGHDTTSSVFSESNGI